RRTSERRARSPSAASISVRLTLYRRASALRRGSRQPGSRCTSAAAIRSASTVVARSGPRPSAGPELSPDAAAGGGTAGCRGTGRSRPGAPAVIPDIAWSCVSLYLGDLRTGQGDHGRRQGLEVHPCQLRRPAGDRPAEERPQVLRPDGAGLSGAHDGVLVVDDGISLSPRPVDERDGLAGRVLVKLASAARMVAAAGST